jgi:putative FmdB family regulatory protein
VILYDYECCRCGNITELFADWDDTGLKPCPECKGDMVRIISVSGQYCANQDADWIKTCVDVVGNETIEGREFKKNPTRDNLKQWMHVKNLRHMEPGEAPSKPKPVDESAMTKKLFEKYRERTRIEI